MVNFQLRHDCQNRTRLKASQYNVFSERADYTYAFNTRSKAFIKLTQDEFHLVQYFLKEESPVAQNFDEENIRKVLIDGQFLIPYDLDELSLLKTKNNITRFAARGIGLVIAPTLRCNFGCEYCYVDLNAGKMSPEVCDRIKRFFEYKLNDGSAATVVWTGGDPSLALDVVSELSKHFIALCDARHVKYDAMMITNGYLLDAYMIQCVRECNIQTLQITLDGNRAFHNSRRFLVGRKPTYDRILDNISAACRDIEIIIRINIDRQNADKIEEVFCDLRDREAAQYVSVFLARVDAINERNSSYKSNCFSTSEFASIQRNLLKTAMLYGLHTISEMPILRNEFCGANSQNFFVIDSQGNLLRCYSDFGTADINGIGYIGTDGREVIDKPSNFLRWLSWDPFSIEECRECKVLPLCMGGCSYKRIRHGKGAELGCITIKFSLDEFLDVYAERLAQDGVGCDSCSNV